MHNQVAPRFILCDCGCADVATYVGGRRPEFLDDETAAAQRFLVRAQGNLRFRGVHLRGQHILNLIIGSEPVLR